MHTLLFYTRNYTGVLYVQSKLTAIIASDRRVGTSMNLSGWQVDISSSLHQCVHHISVTPLTGYIEWSEAVLHSEIVCHVIVKVQDIMKKH